MAVFRVERNRNYTTMSNFHLRDKNLSLKAKGLLSQMLSLPENWDYTLAGLALINAEGKDAIRAAVVELEKAGYVQRRQTTHKDGKFGVNEYIIREYPASYEPPLEEPSSALPLPENPTTGKPSTASTASENPTQINKDSKNKDHKKTDSQITESIPSLFAPSVAPGAGRRSESKGRKRATQKRVNSGEMEAYRKTIRENVGYDDFIRDRPWDAGQLDEMVELMVEAVCSNKETLRVAGSDFPQAVVKSRLLKLESDRIRFVFDCLRENTTQVRNMKQYLLTVLFNAPAIIENHYAALVNHDLPSN